MPSYLSQKGRTGHVITYTHRLLNISLAGIALMAIAATLVLSFVGVDEAAAKPLKRGDILITDRGSSISKIDPVTGAQTLITIGGVLDGLFGIAIDDDGQILVTAFFVRVAGLPAGVGRVDPETGRQTIITTGGFLSAPTGIAIEADGQILVTDSNLGGVVRVDPVTGAQTIVTTGGFLGSLTGITIITKEKNK